MTPQERARKWADACIAKAENYKAGVRAAEAKVAARYALDDEIALRLQLEEIQALPEKDESRPQDLTR